MADSMDKALRGVGWVLFAGGLLALVGFAIYAVAFDDETPLALKLLFAALYGGLALLLVAVLRQRLRERKTDKYRDVQL